MEWIPGCKDTVRRVKSYPCGTTGRGGTVLFLYLCARRERRVPILRESLMDTGMELIEKYFGTELTDLQRDRFARMYDLYGEWNAKINVVSRKDFESLYLKHVLHSLAIARVCRFAAGARVCDVGTGGGFPAVPLAVLFPEARFTAVDSIGKKTVVVREVAAALGLQNIEVVNGRAEALPGRFDYVVSRAVTDMAVLMGWVWNKIERGQCGTLPNGILVLKGGELAEELARAGKRFTVYDIARFFDEPFFETKKVVYLGK